MEKIMLPVSKADILQAISKFPKKDYESLLREIEKLARKEKKVAANFVEAQELKMLSGCKRLTKPSGLWLQSAFRCYDVETCRLLFDN